LISKIAHKIQQDNLAKQSFRAKVMRRNRQKPKSIKIRILEDKRRQAQKKFVRRKINEIEVA